MKKLIILFACLYATNMFAWKYIINNRTGGDIAVVLNAIARNEDYYVTLAPGGSNTLDTGGYCIRGVTVIGRGGDIQGLLSAFKPVSGIECKGRTIDVGPLVRRLENPVQGTSTDIVADFDIKYL